MKGGIWFLDQFITRKNAPPPAFRRYIEENGHKGITSLTVCKAPIQENVNTLLNWITLGKFDQNKQKLDYDKMFHLYLHIGLEDGSKVILEKNQVVNLEPSNGRSAEFTECIDIPVHMGKLFNVSPEELQGLKRLRRDDLENALKGIAPHFQYQPLVNFIGNGIKVLENNGLDLYGYESSRNNCQVFIQAMLVGNDYSTSKTTKFIMQNTEKLIDDLPSLSKGVMNEAISLARFFDTLLNGY